jgi:TonB-dependent siderophore receptor
MMRYRGGWAACLLAGTALASLAPSATTAAQIAQAATETFAIPGQPLDQALAAFSAQTRIQVLAKGEVTRGVASPGANGPLSPEDALRRLLSGTGISYRFTDSRTVILDKTAADGAMTLDPVTVEGSALQAEESVWGPVKGYVAKRSAAATKTDTPLIEVPQTVNVVTRDQMEAQGAQTIIQALRYTPGVAASFGDSDTRSDTLQTRGFYLRDYLDGARLPFGSYSVGVLRVDPYALERIEVLKGPASALYGQSTPGGLLNMVTKRPTAEPLREIELQAGSFDRYQGAFDLSGAADGDGRVLYRLTGLLRDSDGQVDHSYDNRRFIAPAVTLKAGEDTTLTLLSHYQDDETITSYQLLPMAGTLRSNPNGKLSRKTFTGEPDYDGFWRRQYSVGYALDHRLGEAWSLRQNLKYTHVDIDTRAMPGFALGADGRTLSRVATLGEARAGMFALDNQALADFATGPVTHKAIAGFDVLVLDDNYRFSSNTASPIDLYDPVYGTSIPSLIPRMNYKQHMTQTGFYVQDQMKLDNWILTLSGRHDRAESTTKDSLLNSRSQQDDQAFTGRVGLGYLFANGLAPYASYATSFEPVGGADAAGKPFEPTTGTQAEIGVKYEPKGYNGFLALSAFDTVRQNVLTPDLANPLYSVQTGEVRVRGMEFEGKANLAEGLNLLAGYAYTYSDVTKDNPGSTTPSKVGRPLSRTPKHQASLWLDYTFPQEDLAGFGFGGGARYFGANYSDTQLSIELPDYWLFDAAVHYDLGQARPELKGARIGLNVSNLLDKDYVAYCLGSLQCSYGQGRTVMGTLKYQW